MQRHSTQNSHQRPVAIIKKQALEAVRFKSETKRKLARWREQIHETGIKKTLTCVLPTSLASSFKNFFLLMGDWVKSGYLMFCSINVESLTAAGPIYWNWFVEMTYCLSRQAVCLRMCSMSIMRVWKSIEISANFLLKSWTSRMSQF